LTKYLTDHCELAEKEYGLIILDPIYKMLGDTDENANGDVGLLLAALGQMGKQTRTAVIFSHHHSKGGKAHVNILDRMSGAGCWARDPDLIVDLTEHEQDDCYTVQAVPRSFKRPPSRVVRQSFPTFVLEAQLDPTDLKKPGGSKKLYDAALVADEFVDVSKLTNAELVKRLMKRGMGKTTAKQLISEAEVQGKIRTSDKKKGCTHNWTLVTKSDGEGCLI
jgi:hypothetical protein